MVSCYYMSWKDLNQKLWQKFLKQASDAMIAAGWVPKAGKFREVQNRKAEQLRRQTEAASKSGAKSK